MEKDNKQIKGYTYPSFFDLIDTLGFTPELVKMQAGRPVAVNIAIKDDCYFVEASLPGCKKEDIKLSYENKYLVISASRKLMPGIERRACEIPECSFARRVYLEKDVNDEKISASYQDGILSITLPFLELKKKQKIVIM